ncbi:hypothetical protein GGS23DRAFT_424207 [Durotheca rogersii]|uniref:uncharacterized protein n=1 Tax=Durotheca rogersii TaxID=419775 RepID=UPI00221F769A|nr:uncharacterized protein GGS23DRAFT_424207 [Durotheca rogersii]KAI5865372.1 hypothetical protein GGS23DRAFT_424207 [Durotheca rogersii]
MDTLPQWIQDCESHRSIDSYYYFFHKAHPFAPAKSYMQSRIQSQDASAVLLYAAMNYVGCMYQQSPPERDRKALVLQQARRARQPPRTPSPRHVYQVATLLLLTIVAYGKGEVEEASDNLEKAISLAVDIGMDRVDSITALRDREFVELWKRTYWYLYIMADALQDADTNRDFRLECPGPDFPLPCTYDSSPQMTLSQFDTADFEDHAYIFPSLVYLIALVRISQSIKRLNAGLGDHFDRAVIRTHAMLMNWKLHLPLEKQSAVTKSGEIDHIMFQSHILFYSLRVFMHTSLPGSSGGDDEPLRARTRLESCEAGASLLTLPTCLLQMSPLIIKPLSRCAVTSLNTAPPPDSDFHARNNLRLVLGAMKQVSVVWKGAEQESQALKAMARIAYSIPSLRAPANLTTSQPSPVDVLSGDIHFQFHDAHYFDQDGDVGTAAEVRDIFVGTPIFERVSGASEEASVLSWQL